MKHRYFLEGQEVKASLRDINGDGKISSVEMIRLDKPVHETEIIQQSELKESLVEINRDDIDQHTKMSEIDKRTRLIHKEVGAMITWDVLIALDYLPVELGRLTLKKSRFAISLDGKGRIESRDIIIGKREQDRNTGISQFVKNGLGVGAQETR